MEVMTSTMCNSFDLLFLMAFFIGMLLVFFSSIMYFLERGDWEETYGLYIRSDDPMVGQTCKTVANRFFGAAGTACMLRYHPSVVGSWARLLGSCWLFLPGCAQQQALPQQHVSRVQWQVQLR